MRKSAMTVAAVVLFGLLAPFASSGQPISESRLEIEDLQCRGNVATSCDFILGYVYLGRGDSLDETEVRKRSCDSRRCACSSRSISISREARRALGRRLWDFSYLSIGYGYRARLEQFRFRWQKDGTFEFKDERNRHAFDVVYGWNSEDERERMEMIRKWVAENSITPADIAGLNWGGIDVPAVPARGARG